ncbi:MAG: hypothetical protein HQL32_04325, partial [Planctomycetes bacterium]|nr:hypothetical protein [Planctomycetota bacterium]
MQDSQPRRFHRAEFTREVKVFLGSDIVLKGMTKDITTSSASMFVSLKGSSDFFKSKGIDVSRNISLVSIKNCLENESVLIEFQDDNLTDAYDMTISRIENSWVRG